MKDNSFNEISQYWKELAELNRISNNKMNQLYNKFMTTKDFKEWENKDKMDIIFSEEMFNKFMKFYKREMGEDMIIKKETKFEDAILKLPNLDKLLTELNAPIEIEGVESEGEFNFKYRVNGDFLELYDEYENYTIDYEEDMNYMMEGLSSEFGAGFDYYEDNILPRIEEALKKDGFTEPLEWENNVVMVVELPNKLKVKDSKKINDGYEVYHYKGYIIEIDEDFAEAKEYGYYVPEEPWDLYSPSGKYIKSFKHLDNAKKYVDKYIKDSLAPRYIIDGDLLEVIDYLQDEPYGLDIKQVDETTYKTADIYFKIDSGKFVVYDDNGELIEVCDTSDELIETILDHNDWHDDFDEKEFEKQEEFDKAAAEELAYRIGHAKGYDSIKDVKPKKGESKKDFIARFMKETAKEYPDEKQRAAIAYSYWDKRNIKDSSLVIEYFEKDGLYTEYRWDKDTGYSASLEKIKNGMGYTIKHKDHLTKENAEKYFKKYKKEILTNSIEDVYIEDNINDSKIDYQNDYWFNGKSFGLIYKDMVVKADASPHNAKPWDEDYYETEIEYEFEIYPSDYEYDEPLAELIKNLLLKEDSKYQEMIKLPATDGDTLGRYYDNKLEEYIYDDLLGYKPELNYKLSPIVEELYKKYSQKFFDYFKDYAYSEANKIDWNEVFEHDYEE